MDRPYEVEGLDEEGPKFPPARPPVTAHADDVLSDMAKNNDAINTAAAFRTEWLLLQNEGHQKLG